MIDFLTMPSPCYVLDERLLDANLAVIDRVRRESGAEISQPSLQSSDEKQGLWWYRQDVM